MKRASIAECLYIVGVGAIGAYFDLFTSIVSTLLLFVCAVVVHYLVRHIWRGKGRKAHS